MTGRARIAIAIEVRSRQAVTRETLPDDGALHRHARRDALDVA